MMKISNLLFLFLLFSQWAIAQDQKLTKEDLFKRYLVSNSPSIAEMLINSNDGVYSLYCQGMLTEELPEKIDLFTKFIQLDPEYGVAEAYLQRGLAYGSSEKKDSALADYNASIQRNPKDAYTYYFRGEAYYSLKKYNEAIEDYTRAITIAPDFALAYHMRGLSLLDMGEFKKALTDFNRAIEIDKSFDQAYFLRGSVFEAMGDYQKAIDDWETAKELNATNAELSDQLIARVNSKMKKKE